MYLTAQRVVAPSGNTGINVYHYAHPSRPWAIPPQGVPEDDPGELQGKKLELPPGGNRVRSYLDIVAADGAPTEELLESFRDFLAAHEGQPLPWSGLQGHWLFRVGMESGLAAQWRRELAALLKAIASQLEDDA